MRSRALLPSRAAAAASATSSFPSSSLASLPRGRPRSTPPPSPSPSPSPSLLVRGFRTAAYDDLFRRSVDPRTREAFWSAAAAEHVAWRVKPSKILSVPDGDGSDAARLAHAKWFVDGELNITESCLDRHVAGGRGSVTAVAYDSPVTGVQTRISYAELLDKVEAFASVLRAQGVQTGDRVVIYMPMIPEAVVAMLACARVGACHSVVFGGFAPRELAVRVDDATPKAIITASCGVEVSRVVEYAPIVKAMLEQIKMPVKPLVICKHRDPTSVRPDLPTRETVRKSIPQALDWDAAMRDATKDKAKRAATAVPSTHPLYVLYTSGTTGTPKGIVRDTGGCATMLGFVMKNFMQTKLGDTYFCSSDLGWVVGHQFILYGPLLAGLTTVLYEGKPINTPDAGAFWRVIQQYRATHMYTAPTALRAVRRADPKFEMLRKYDISSLRAVFLAGERADPDTIKAYVDALGVPAVDNFWMTETGSPVCGYQHPARGVVPGSTALPCPGFNVQVLDEATNKPVKRGEQGMVCVELPMPPGALTTVFNNEARYMSSYMKPNPGYFATGDVGFQEEDGYVHIMSRNDDLINVAGHRLSTGTIEAALMGHPHVAEVACVGAPNSLKGEVCLGLVVLQAGHEKDAAKVEKELIQRVRDVVGPVASFHDCFVIEHGGLPKTKSGKILRGVIKKIAAGDANWDKAIPPTVEDVAPLHTIAGIIARRFKRE